MYINLGSGAVLAACNALVGVLIYPIYLHFLGYEQLGIWLTLATVLTLVQLGQLGMAPALSQLVAEANAQRNHNQISEFLSAALALSAIITAALLTCASLFSTLILEMLGIAGHPGIGKSILVTVVAVSAYTFVVELFLALLAGLGQIYIANAITVGAQALSAALATVLLATGHGFKSIVIAQGISKLFAHAGCLIAAKKYAGYRLTLTRNVSRANLNTLLSFGMSVFSGTALTMLLTPLNKVLLNRTTGPTFVAAYDICYVATMQLRAVIETAFRALVPEVGRMKTLFSPQKLAEDIGGLKRLIFKINLMAALPVYCLAFVLADFGLHLWLRHRLVEGQVLAFRVMLVGTYCSLVATGPYHILIGLRRLGSVVAGYGIQSGVSLFVALIALVGFGRFSLLAAVIATSSGMLACTVFLLRQLRSYTKVLYQQTEIVPLVL